MGKALVEKVTVNEELVRAGLAWVYDRYCHNEQGLCREAGEIPPWEFRRQKKALIHSWSTVSFPCALRPVPYASYLSLVRPAILLDYLPTFVTFWIIAPVDFRVDVLGRGTMIDCVCPGVLFT